MSFTLQLDCMNESDLSTRFVCTELPSEDGSNVNVKTDEVMILPVHWAIAAEIFHEQLQEIKQDCIEGKDFQLPFIADVQMQSKPKIRRRIKYYYTIQDYLGIDDKYQTSKEKEVIKRKKQRISIFLIETGQDLSGCSRAMQDEIIEHADRCACIRDRDKIYRNKRREKEKSSIDL